MSRFLEPSSCRDPDGCLHAKLSQFVVPVRCWSYTVCGMLPDRVYAPTCGARPLIFTLPPSLVCNSTLTQAYLVQGPDVARQYTDQLVAAAAQLSDQAEPLAQQFVEEQLKPTAHELARTLEPRVCLSKPALAADPRS